MKQVMASIITIGDELLIGQVIDTNSAFIAQQLNQIGIWSHRRIAVGDVWDEIWEALNQESAVSDIVLITGGLGPTTDDITKPLLCKYFQTELIENQDSLRNLKAIFKDREMPEKIFGQALLPASCIPVFNKRGTAFGMWFEKNETIFVSMPGVPFEMKGMITDYVIPELQKRFELPTIAYRTVLTAGKGESAINETIQDFEDALPSNIQLAYLPDLGKVRVRLTTSGADANETIEQLDQEFTKLKVLLEDITVSDNGDNMEEALGKILIEKQLTVGTAESCTAGNIAHVISSVPGSSRYLLGGIVSYSNEVKHNLLGVKEETLAQYGAVSEQTVKEMVKGCLDSIHADVAVAVSGILGPDGGTPEKPVGTVWVAVGNQENMATKCLHLRYNNRERNMQATTNAALNMLFRFVTGKQPL
ncbi:MAG: damage-inducible protein CinA [Pseudopedobacter saltans]|uniref:CinA-like protein n=1 Tax=Pseudopedobacter saltans TaxID=151895 RepID=A0A2W5FBF5_9SPHI|nr:MAG: damage-inducible protein CinA [Pseudopedobacter saltans]